MAASRPVRVSIGVVALLAVVGGVWFLARGPHDEFATLSGHKDGAFCLALSPDGTALASGGGEGAVRVWDVGSKRQKLALTGHTGMVTSVAWSPDGNTLATGGDDKSIRLWDTKTGDVKEVRTNFRAPVAGLAFSSDGKILAAALDRVIFYWDASISREPRTYRA